jgi:hypothetical protein
MQYVHGFAEETSLVGAKGSGYLSPDIPFLKLGIKVALAVSHHNHVSGSRKTRRLNRLPL